MKNPIPSLILIFMILLGICNTYHEHYLVPRIFAEDSLLEWCENRLLSCRVNELKVVGGRHLLNSELWEVSFSDDHCVFKVLVNRQHWTSGIDMNEVVCER